MIPVPDISQTYPKTGLKLDSRFTVAPRFVSDGSAFFDGSNDSVQVDGFTLATSSANYSIMFWFKTASTSSDQRMFVIQNTTSGAKCLFYMNNGSIVHFNGTASTAFSATSSMNDGNWHCLHHTVASGTTGKFYIDGKEQVSKTVTNIDLSAADDMRIGSNNTGSANFFNGYIANVAIWQGTALSVDQVRQTMSANSYAVTNSVAALRGYWQLVDDYNDDAGTQNGTNSGSVLSPVQVRLPLGYDFSGNLNNGTLVTGRALSLDGTGDYLDGGTIAAHAFTGSLTVSLWAKTSSATEQTFLMKFSGGSTGYQITLRADQSDAYWQCSVADSAGWQHARANESHSGIPAALDDGVWRHITLRANNGTLEAYVNGVIGGETDTYENTTALGTSGQRMTIGGNYAGTPSNLVTGSMCGVKIFNVALSAAQILEQYNNPEQVLPTGASAASLISYWPLADYDNSTANSLDGLYFMDLGTAKSNAKAYNSGMDLAESPPCPQLGLMPSTSRRFLDQSNDHWTAGAGITQSGGLAISAWVIPNQDSSGVCIFETANDGNSRTGLLITTTGKAQFQHYAGAGYFGKADDGGVSYAGKLMHIVACYDGTGWDTDGMKLYVNGSEKTSTSITSFGTQGSDSTAIGARFVAGGSPSGNFGGHILSCAVWTDDITAAEVTALYNGGPELSPLSDSGNYASSGDLAHYWKMNTAYTVEDLKGSKDLTRVGGTEMTTIPEGATAGATLFGSTEEKRADNAVINLNGKEYVTIPHDVNLNPDLSEGFTCSAWFKMRSLGSGSSTPIFDKDGGNDRWYLRIRDDASDVYQFNFGDGSGTTDVAGGTLSDTNWHHVVVTLDYGEDEGIFYVDGSAVGSATDISARTADCPGTDALTIGADGTTAVLDGAVAYPKIYARALTANEIKLLYSSGHRVVGGL